jgi:hypothetical protein
MAGKYSTYAQEIGSEGVIWILVVHYRDQWPGFCEQCNEM